MRETHSDVIREMVGDENVKAFAARAGVSWPALYKWLRGEKAPRVPSLVALARVATVSQMIRLLVALEILPNELEEVE